MKKSTKVLSLILSLVIVSSSLIGCGTKTDSTSSADSTQAAQSSVAAQSTTAAEPIVLQYWGGVPEENGPAQVAKNFNKLDPNVQIQYTRFTNDDSGNTKLDVSLMSGTDIDIFVSYNDSTLAKRVVNKSVMDIGDIAEKAGIDMKAYFGDDIEKFKIDGKYYQIPTTSSNKCILYNQKMFDDAGIPYPEAGWTYDDFLAAAKKLTKGEGANKVYGYYYPAWGGGQPVTEFVNAKLGSDWMYTADGKASAIDIADIRTSFDAFLARMKDGIEVNFVDNKTQKMTPQDMLLKGQAAMVYGNWIGRYVKDTATYPHDFKVGFATVPKLGGASQEKLTTSGFGDYHSISSNSKNSEVAMKFIKWYIDAGFDAMIPAGRIPSSKNYDRAKVAKLAFEGSEALFDMDSAQKVFLGSFDIAIRSNSTASAEIETVLTEEFEKAFAGAQSADDAIKNAQKRADEKIAAVTK